MHQPASQPASQPCSCCTCSLACSHLIQARMVPLTQRSSFFQSINYTCTYAPLVSAWLTSCCMAHACTYTYMHACMHAQQLSTHQRPEVCISSMFWQTLRNGRQPPLPSKLGTPWMMTQRKMTGLDSRKKKEPAIKFTSTFRTLLLHTPSQNAHWSVFFSH